MRTHLAFLASATVALAAFAPPAGARERGAAPPPAAPPADPPTFEAGVVGPELGWEALEAAQCACLTAVGLAQWCGGWSILLGQYDPELLDINPVFARGVAISSPDEQVVLDYLSCSGAGGFRISDEVGQTTDDVIDLGYDPGRPVHNLKVACAAGYQTGALPLPIPPRALFY